MNKINKIILFVAVFGLLPVLAFAQEDHDGFPVWTYYGEIVEHIAMAIISIIAIIFLAKFHNYPKFDKSIQAAIIGFGLFALSEFLTTLQHFLLLVFGDLTGLVNHGILLVSIAVITYALIEFYIELRK